MADPNLVNYFKQNMAAGYDKYELCNNLIASGYQPNVVKEALKEAIQEKMPNPPKVEIKKTIIDEKGVVVSSPLMGILAIIIIAIVIATTYYVMFKPVPTGIELQKDGTVITLPPQCKECEYLEGMVCIKSNCCKDEDCATQFPNMSNTCQFPNTKDARCVSSIIECGNNLCEIGEENTCCVDCGCKDGICIENSCISTNPILMLISPNEGDSVESPFNVKYEIKDKAIYTLVYIQIDNETEKQVTEKEPSLTLEPGTHEITLILKDNEKQVQNKTIKLNVKLPKIPKLDVTFPISDDNLSTSEVIILFSVRDFELKEVGGHIHFTLDGNTIEHYSTGSYTFENVPAGPHVLYAALFNSNELQLTNIESFKTIMFNT